MTSWTIEEHQKWLIGCGRRWASKHGGKPPRVKDWKGVEGTEWPSYQTAVRAFDTWDNFIKACGFEPRGRGRPRLD